MNKIYKILISILFTFIIIKILNLNIINFINSISFLHILWLFLFFFISYLLSSLRFLIIIKFFNGHIQYSRSLVLTIYQNFFNSLSITGSGEIVKFIKKNRIKSFTMATSIIVEKLTGVIASLSIILFSTLFIIFKFKFYNNDLFLIFLLIIIISLYFINNIFLNKVPYFYFIKKNFYKKDKKFFLLNAILISIFLQITSISLYIILLKLNGIENTNYLLIAIIVPLINLISAAPISVSGIGVRDLSGIFFLSFVSITPQISANVTYTIGIFSILFPVFFLLLKFIFDALSSNFYMSSRYNYGQRYPIKKIK